MKVADNLTPMRIAILFFILVTSLGEAQQVRFCNDRDAFNATTTNMNLVDFENVAPPGGVLSMPSFSASGAEFSSSPGQGNLTIADADNNNTLGAPYASDILLINLTADSLRITFPAGTTAVGGDFGSLWSASDLGFALELTNGTLVDMFVADAPGFSLRGRPGFCGWIVRGGEISSLTISGAFEAVDNVAFGSTLSTGSLCPRSSRLPAGDMVVADVVLQGLIHVEAATGAQRIITRRGFLHDPAGVLFDKDGSILVADYFYDWQQDNYFGRIVRVDPVTGMQRLLMIGGLLRGPTGLAFDTGGNLLVADAFGNRLLRVDLDSGQQQVVSADGSFVFPTAMAVDPEGNIFVIDQNALGGMGCIIRIDPATGAQQPIVVGSFSDPAGIVMDGRGDLIVVDSTAASPSFDGLVARVNPGSGNAALLSVGGFLGQPWGIAREAGGSLIVSIMGGDQKGVIRVNPNSGVQTRISLGGTFIRPFGVAVSPRLQPLACDVNGDDEISAADVAAFVAVLLGSPLDPADVGRADVNRDGAADGLDVTELIGCIGQAG